MGAQVAEALVAAHADGITHRDVNPANIMLDMQGRVRLTDFGIAHVHTELEENAPDESFVGTPRYMSPEQCASRDITASTDLFSLGIVLYEMIAGRSEEHTSELQSRENVVCRLLLVKTTHRYAYYWTAD